jgi:hypothetical protein
MDLSERFALALVDCDCAYRRRSGVGGPKTRGLPRGIAFAAVVALHAGLVITLVAFRTPTSPSAPTEFITALIFLTAPLPPVASLNRRRPPVADETSPVAPVEPPTTPPPVISLPIGADTAIDWAAEARRAAAGVTGADGVREFGQIPKADSGRAPLRSPPAHEAGEQYRTEDGAWIVWVSDRCYIVSEVPPLGLPQVLARSIPTRTVCQGDAEPRSDLFKDLPAYRKYHPQ